jgi:hypothetical protein
VRRLEEQHSLFVSLGTEAEGEPSQAEVEGVLNTSALVAGGVLMALWGSWESDDCRNTPKSRKRRFVWLGNQRNNHLWVGARWISNKTAIPINLRSWNSEIFDHLVDDELDISG